MSPLISITHIVVLVIMITAAFLAVVLRDLLSSVIALAAASLLLALEYYLLHAPDVAIAEAGIGAALTMAIYIFAIRATKK
ncbi:MAG: hydrogenase subunit MbhD domain-containing protein [Candidatus Caldatribacteriota bacterium]